MTLTAPLSRIFEYLEGSEYSYSHILEHLSHYDVGFTTPTNAREIAVMLTSELGHTITIKRGYKREWYFVGAEPIYYRPNSKYYI